MLCTLVHFMSLTTLFARRSRINHSQIHGSSRNGARLVKDWLSRYPRELLSACEEKQGAPPGVFPPVYPLFISRLQDCLYRYPGPAPVSSDEWTVLNTKPMVAWVFHVQFEGRMLYVLLDVRDVSEISMSNHFTIVTLICLAIQSHTGTALAREFQHALE